MMLARVRHKMYGNLVQLVCVTDGRFSGQARHGTDCRKFPLLSIEEKSDAVNGPRLTFAARPNNIGCRMLQIGGIS